MKDQRLPVDHHLLRYIKPSQIVFDPQDASLRTIIEDAFRPRETDNHELSTTWVEYFEGDAKRQRIAAVQAIRASKLTPRPKGGFACGRIGGILSAARERGHKLRIVHDPAEDNAAHAAVKRVPEDDELLRVFASEVWSELMLNAEIDPGAARAPSEPCSAAKQALEAASKA